MKRKILTLLLAGCMILSMTACNNNSNTEEEVSERYVNKIYKKSENTIELNMGTYINEEKMDLCSIKVPESYMLYAAALDKDGKEIVFDMANGTTTASEAVKNGVLEKESAYAIMATNSNIVKEGSKETKVSFMIYNNGPNTYAMIRRDVDVIGNLDSDAHNGFFYKEKGNNTVTDLKVCCKLNDYAALVINYYGPLVDQITEREIAEDLYRLVKVNKGIEVDESYEIIDNEEVIDDTLNNVDGSQESEVGMENTETNENAENIENSDSVGAVENTEDAENVVDNNDNEEGNDIKNNIENTESVQNTDTETEILDNAETNEENVSN